MAIRFRRVQRMADPRTPDVKKFYPVISYKYDTPVTLREVAVELSVNSGISEGATLSVLKDFRALLRKVLLNGRSLNLDGLGYFYLAAKSAGKLSAEELSANDISGLRVCFRANKDIRLTANGALRTRGLAFKDLDRLNDVVNEAGPEGDLPLGPDEVPGDETGGQHGEQTTDPDATDRPGGGGGGSSEGRDPVGPDDQQGKDPAGPDDQKGQDPVAPDTGDEGGRF